MEFNLVQNILEKLGKTGKNLNDNLDIKSFLECVGRRIPAFKPGK